MAKHAKVPAPADAGARVARTVVQVAIPAILGLVLILPEVIDLVDKDLGEHLPPEFRVAMLGVAAAITALSALASKVMALQSVNDWLSRWTPFGTMKRAQARELDD